MGHLAQSVDMHATQLERSILGMIKSVILAAQTSLWTFIDEFTTRVSAFESKQGKSYEVTALKDKATDLRKDIDYLSLATSVYSWGQITLMLLKPRGFLQLPPEMCRGTAQQMRS